MVYPFLELNLYNFRINLVMLTEHKRFLIRVIIGLVLLWAIVFIGYKISAHYKVSPEKIKQYLDTVDLSKLSPSERAKTLNKLAEMVNSLQYEERRRVRLRDEWKRLFDQMTDQEKNDFIEKTVPVGFKKMIESFEKLPEDRRKKVINDALRRLKEVQESLAAESSDSQNVQRYRTNAVVLSPELENKIRMIGLRTFYNESSAQTKAELAPLLEEIQRLMERGDAFKGMQFQR